ncbi:MAG: DUF5668 domain-containing protein [Chloroflexota bacterium]|nr:DUF5668 domain-containing protein [Chloroflexota bacterium]
MSDQFKYQKRYRSLFWPVVLIGAGAIWLMANLEIIPVRNLWLLFRLWPVLIILAGLDVLFAHRLAVVGALLGLLLLAGVVYVLWQGEDLGLQPEPQVEMETISLGLGEVETADFNLDLSVQEASIHPLTNSDLLIFGEIGHFGTLDFNTSGVEDAVINLRQTGSLNRYNWFLPEIRGEDLTWDIGLSTAVPFDLDVDASTGKAELDLSGVQLDDFEYDASTGASTIILPASSEGYETRLDASTGSLHVFLPAESNLTVILDGSTGRVTFDVPEGAAIQIEVRSGGTGSLQLPAWIDRVQGMGEPDEGLYESAGFDEAEYQLVIVIDDISTGKIVFE